MVWADGLGTSSVTDMTPEQEQANPEQAEKNAEQNLKEAAAQVAPFQGTNQNGQVGGPSTVGEALSLTPINAVSGITPSGVALRYPRSPEMSADADYVMFQFYKYKPPFRDRKGTIPTIVPSDGEATDVFGNNVTVNQLIGSVTDYNDQDQYADTERAQGYSNIVMYMPEDISTGFRAQWGGKNLTNFTAGLLKTVGQGEGATSAFSKIAAGADALGSELSKAPMIAGAKAIQAITSSVGGDSLSLNDVFGSISGAILNPNTELLFGGVDMRNFQLNFKLVPRDIDEAAMCNSIVAHFKKASLPDRDPGVVFGSDNANVRKSFIGAPKLVRVTFMHGSNEHPQLPRFKMCALTQVDVNYTPDGTYATYRGGQPVAMVLTLNFQETKICFADEVNANGVGGIR